MNNQQPPMAPMGGPAPGNDIAKKGLIFAIISIVGPGILSTIGSSVIKSATSSNMAPVYIGLVLSIVGVIAGLVLAIIGVKNASAGKKLNQEAGFPAGGLAIAGLVIGIISIVENAISVACSACAACTVISLLGAAASYAAY